MELLPRPRRRAGTFLHFQPKSGKSLEDARIAADFYAPLDRKSRFKAAEIKGTAKVGGEEAYVVVFTPEKGNPVTDYYSTKSFLLLRRDTIETQGPSASRSRRRSRTTARSAACLSPSRASRTRRASATSSSKLRR